MPSAVRPRIAAVVATDERPALLARCLERLAAERHPDLGEVLVVAREDDAAGAAVARAAAARDPRVALVPTRARSRSAARNDAAARARASWLWFIDDDAEPEPGSAAVLAAALDAWPGAAVVGGPNVGPADPTPFEAAADAVLASPLGGARMAWRYRAGGPAGPCTERELIACNLAVAREAFLARRFDERLDYGEETLLLAAMRLDGLTLVREPRLLVRHRRRAGWAAFARQAWSSGLGRARQTALLPRSFTPECAGPALLVAAAAAALWRPEARAALAAYGLACATQAAWLSPRGAGVALRAAPLLALAHLAYGAGLLAGLAAGPWRRS